MNKQDSLNLVNASGFAFQLGVEYVIQRTQQTHGWRIIAREHRWTDGESGNEGFIDLVLENESARMVVECKRVRNGRWVFLVTEPRQRFTDRAALLWTHQQADRRDILDWSELQVARTSPESEFCVVRGQGERDRPMLERFSGIVLKSVESLAVKELGLNPQKCGLDRAIVYIPVIVTNAKLEMCCFHPRDVDLLEGKLARGGVEIESVPCIRFHKSLTTTLTPIETPTNLTEANRAGKRTVFVIHVSELAEVLRSMVLSGGNSPWLKIRELESRPREFLSV